MAMRLDVEFTRSLTKAERLRALLAAATLSKAASLRFDRGGMVAVVLGEGLGARRLREALAELDLSVANVRSSLDDEEDVRCEDAPGGPNGPERVRPVGR